MHEFSPIVSHVDVCLPEFYLCMMSYSKSRGTVRTEDTA